MERLHILVAGGEAEIQDEIFSYFKDKYNLLMLMPPSIDCLFQKPFINSSLAIIDFGFSNYKGLQAIKRLKASKQSLPIIFSASHGAEELGFRAFKLGARDSFIKPFITTDLIHSIELILSSSREEKGNRSNVLLNKYAEIFVAETTLQNNNPAIEKTKKYIEENFTKTFSLDLLAGIAYKSKFHLCRKFKEQEGMTCSEYLNTVRIKEAKTLLKNYQLSISEICYLTGYNDLTYFGRVFKNLEGVSPSAYRKKL